jgi:hypothetical protein
MHYEFHIVLVVIQGFAFDLQNNLKLIYALVNHDALLYANKTCLYLQRLSQLHSVHFVALVHHDHICLHFALVHGH